MSRRSFIYQYNRKNYNIRSIFIYKDIKTAIQHLLPYQSPAYRPRLVDRSWAWHAKSLCWSVSAQPDCRSFFEGSASCPVTLFLRFDLTIRSIRWSSSRRCSRLFWYIVLSDPNKSSQSFKCLNQYIVIAHFPARLQPVHLKKELPNSSAIQFILFCKPHRQYLQFLPGRILLRHLIIAYYRFTTTIQY